MMMIALSFDGVLTSTKSGIAPRGLKKRALLMQNKNEFNNVTKRFFTIGS